MLGIQHTEAGVYSAADLNLLARLAEHVIAAIADAQLYRAKRAGRNRVA